RSLSRYLPFPLPQTSLIAPLSLHDALPICVHWSREPHHRPVQHHSRQLRLIAQEWSAQRDPSAQEIPQRARAEGLLQGAIDLTVRTRDPDTELIRGDVDLAGQHDGERTHAQHAGHDLLT